MCVFIGKERSILASLVLVLIKVLNSKFSASPVYVRFRGSLVGAMDPARPLTYELPRQGNAE